MEKVKPLGICDNCSGEIRDGWYTSKHRPRRYCSRDCRNAGNSRAGAPVRSAKAKRRVAAGVWVNPLNLETPEQRREHARKAGQATARQHRAALADGTWRNPALSNDARAKLSRPRTIDDPVLHRAQERLNAGEHMRDLTPEEREAYRAHSRDVASARREPQTRRHTAEEALRCVI
jgi:hypothetical protein